MHKTHGDHARYGMSTGTHEIESASPDLSTWSVAVDSCCRGNRCHGAEVERRRAIAHLRLCYFQLCVTFFSMRIDAMLAHQENMFANIKLEVKKNFS